MVTSTYVAEDLGPADVQRLLGAWGIAYRREFKWSHALGEQSLVRTPYFRSAEEAESEARRMAVTMGYRPARRWEFWRWFEKPLPGA